MIVFSQKVSDDLQRAARGEETFLCHINPRNMSDEKHGRNRIPINCLQGHFGRTFLSPNLFISSFSDSQLFYL